jgi:hypothetical protein
MVSMRPRKLLPRSHIDCGGGFHGLNETVEAASVVYMRPRNWLSRSLLDRGSHYLNFLAEFEAIFEMALALESGPWGELFDEKN